MDQMTLNGTFEAGAAKNGTVFDLFAFFAVPVTANGFFEDRFGTVRRRFSVEIEGRSEGQQLTLNERFRYDDGVCESRIWTLIRTSEARFIGTADDIAGRATGMLHADCARMLYNFPVDTGRSKLITRFDDRFTLVDPDTMVSRARVSKWGIRLGEVVVCFKREPQFGRSHLGPAV